MNKILLSILLLIFLAVANAQDVIKLTEDNHIVIRGPINGMSASKITNELVKNKSKELYIFISSNGGSVTSGMQIVQTIQALQKSGVKVTCIGNVALSMGFVILQYCDNRYVMPSSVLMQHQMSLGIDGPLKNVNSYMDFINTMDLEIENHQAERLNLTLESFKRKVDHDWWLFGSSAVNYGVADKLVYVLCDFKVENYQETLFTIFGKVTLTYSSCPLARDPLDVKFDDNFPVDQIQQFNKELTNIMIPRKEY